MAITATVLPLVVVTVLPIVVMTILMMAALAILMIAVVAMISSLCVLVYDKAYLRRLALVPFSLTVLPTLCLRREHDSNTA